MTPLARRLLQTALFIGASLALFWWSTPYDLNTAIGSMLLSLVVFSPWLAWRLYRVGLIFGGMMLFYWFFDIQAGDERSYWALWIIAAFMFGFFFAWAVTIPTTWAMDGFYRAFGNKPLKQSSD